MKLFFHYSAENFSNTYLVGPEDGGGAVLIDPGAVDTTLLDLIEGHNFYIRWILITRCEGAHLRGLKTLKRIYNAEIYARNNRVLDFDCHAIKPGNHFDLGGIPVAATVFQEYSHDAVIYRIGNWLFCGDILSAGDIGRVGSSYQRENLREALEKKFFHLDDDVLIFPGEGPPTSMRSEKMTNRRSFGQ